MFYTRYIYLLKGGEPGDATQVSKLVHTPVLNSELVALLMISIVLIERK